MTQRTAAWYGKPAPTTFVDTVALVHRHLWLASHNVHGADVSANSAQIPDPMYTRLIDALAYAA